MSRPETARLPLAPAQRLTLLDALRGFALAGVCVSNVVIWFSAAGFQPEAVQQALLHGASRLDLAAAAGVRMLVRGRFLTLFSFLFGLGFALQLGRAAQRGQAVAPSYCRRLGVLLALGLLHMWLWWFNDVLSLYALLGVSLLLLRHCQDRALLWLAAGLIVASPLLGLALQPPGGAEAEALRAGMLAALTHGSYLDVLRAQAAFLLGEHLPGLAALGVGIVGRFALGLVAGRRGLFEDPARHRRLFHGLLWGGLAVGGLGTGGVLLVQWLGLRSLDGGSARGWLLLVLGELRQLREVGLAAFYLAGFTLLFQRPRARRVLGVLAPVGRMALTHYLAQSLIAVTLFYGFGLGLIRRGAGPAEALAVALGIIALQLLLSRLWLAHFQYGPLEYLWRTLSYGRAPPLRASVRPEARNPGPRARRW